MLLFSSHEKFFVILVTSQLNREINGYMCSKSTIYKRETPGASFFLKIVVSFLGDEGSLRAPRNRFAQGEIYHELKTTVYKSVNLIRIILIMYIQHINKKYILHFIYF